jgi:anti-sigma-K factor RskA
MTGTSTTDPGRNNAERADEYVCGLLDAGEARRLEEEMETNAALRRAVAAAQDRFHELDLTVEPVTPSSDLWPRIEAALGASHVSGDSADHPATTRTALPTAAPAANDNTVQRWRSAALAGLAASLVLAIGLAWNLMSGGASPGVQIVAVLVDDEGEPLVIVEDFGDNRARITPLIEFDVPEDRVMQVWTLPSQEMGPMSLGLLDDSETTILEDFELPTPQDNQLYEITIEQEGGSPTGRPTGEILVKGFGRFPR